MPTLKTSRSIISHGVIYFKWTTLARFTAMVNIQFNNSSCAIFSLIIVVAHTKGATPRV